MKDPEFIAEAEKSKLETTYVSGEEVENYVKQSSVDHSQGQRTSQHS